ncbi:MAG: glycosyltransferase, partial [Paracoccaceae bacterium]
RKTLELNTLQRLVISVTGHSTALFRTPYGRGLGPLTAAEALPFVALDQRGYLVVGANVVPPDWQDVAPADIVAAALAQLAPSGGNVIVLHDAGGDRSATVAALPTLIKALREKGFRFVSLAQMLGVPREALMPTETGARVTLDAYSFSVVGAIGTVLRGIFWLAIVLGGVRSTLILILALTRRHYPIEGRPYTPSVTVVIPAYNEEGVIVRSIEAVLASDYPDLRLIVVDDGSNDHTCALAEAAFANDPRIEIIREANMGKWMALDTAYSRIKTEVVVSIDADTIILPDAIRKLVRAFRDPAVGAVAGKVQVGNRGTLLTKLQALEYTIAQNIDRRAAEVFNGILVVPGAIGAWRAAAVRKAGLYTNETLAEDADLTVSVLRAGYRVVYEEAAISITEAPETLRSFMKQRLRWTFGMMQTGWKHRRAAREGRPVGLISIPDLWLFGVVMALLAPIADLVFLSVVVDALINFILGQPLLKAPTSTLILAGYLALPAMEVLTALVAFAFERKLPVLVLLIPVQRLFYRQLLYITVYRAVWRALTGKLAEWGKLVRLGTVRLPGP